MCPDCYGEGLFVDVSTDSPVTLKPGFVVVERCDSCEKYENDFVAAQLTFGEAFYTTDANGGWRVIAKPEGGAA